MQTRLLSVAMLSTALALLTACPQTADAQGFRFGRQTHRKSLQKKLEKLNQAQRYTRMVAPKKVNIDDWTEVNLEGNQKFRYVYGYDKDRNRTSESIYITRRENGQWGAEELLTVGTYVYEYNAQGKLRKKTVNYTPNSIFDSYYIETAPQQDGTTQYVRYESSGDTYQRKEMWICRADGTLAEVRKYTHSDANTEAYDAKFYNTLGEQAGYLKKSDAWQSGCRAEGQLNDSTIQQISSDSYNQRSCHYKYNADLGRIAYLKEVNYGDEDRTTYEYDTFGRLVKIAYSQPLYDDEEVVPSPNPGSLRAAPANEDTEVTTFTYASDEVYAVNNPWRAVFGFEGPLASVHFVETTGGKVNYEETNTFKRDASGKLQTVDRQHTGNTVWVKDSIAISVDPFGQIDKTYSYFREMNDYDQDGVVDYDYTSEITDNYTWENGLITHSLVVDKNTTTNGYGKETSEGTQTSTYTYTDNGFTDKCHQIYQYSDGQKYESDMLSTLKQEGKKLSIYTKDADRAEKFIVVDVQNRDLKFERPNALVMNHNGFSPEPPVVVSVNGRVAAAEYRTYGNYDEGKYHYGTSYLEMAAWNESELFINQCENYFDVSEENGQTVCRNILGYPIYVLEGNKLVQEYDYYDLDYAVNPATTPNSVRGIELPKGKGYELTTYTYNGKGLLVAKKQTYTDANGVTEELLDAEYNYDPTGIVQVTANGKVGATLSGRNLSIGQGNFSVATPDGRILASEVSSFRLPAAGVYIVTANGASIKVYVK